MDPSDFPNPNSADDDMPMFGGGGGGGRAHWPGHEDYRVETPGSVGSTFVDETEFDPFFNTDAYPVEEMEPSCGQPSAPPRKKKMARKDKAPAVPLPSDAPNNEYATGRTDYTMEEYTAVAECWINITEDSINSNHQTSARMWDRIEARYNAVKPSWAFKQTREQLCKCWDRIKLHVNNFRDIYTKLRDGRGSGESMEDVIEKAMADYQSKYEKFKFYNIWLKLKDKPKFDGGIPIASSTPKRTKNTASGGYTSSGGPSPMDLNAEPEGSSGTPKSTFRHPVGNKTARAQARGKATASGSAPPLSPSAQLVASALQEFGDFRESYDYRFILDAQNSLNNTTDPAARRRLEKMIANLSKKLDLDY